MIRILCKFKNAGVHTHKEWANANPPNLLAASKVATQYFRDVVDANGRASGVRVWVEVNGQSIAIAELPQDLSDARLIIVRNGFLGAMQ